MQSHTQRCEQEELLAGVSFLLQVYKSKVVNQHPWDAQHHRASSSAGAAVVAQSLEITTNNLWTKERRAEREEQKINLCQITENGRFKK